MINLHTNIAPTSAHLARRFVEHESYQSYREIF
jgi:hypothetical protein